MTSLSLSKTNTTKTISLDISAKLGNFKLVMNQQIPAQGITGIFGHSGSGKSSLLRIIMGLEKRAFGQIVINNQQVLDTDNNHFVKPEHRRIAMVFQDSRLFPHLNVYENLMFGAKRRQNKGTDEAKISIDEVLALTQLSSFKEKRINKLSGGEQQRVALARALLSEPQLLLLDEPLSALDKENKALMLALLSKIQQRLAIPVLYVSHSLAELQQVSEHLLVISSGNVIDFGNIHQVIHRLNNQGLIEQQTSLSLPIKEHFTKFGLTSLALNSEQEIFTPLMPAHHQIGKSIRCFIFANDISITLEEPKNSSIVNHLHGEITVIIEQGNSILLTLNCSNTLFYVRITSLSHQRLKLVESMQVYIQFKASAVKTFSVNPFLPSNPART